MKNFTKLRMALTLALMVIGMATAVAQVGNPLTAGSQALYKQGTNVADPAGALPATAANESPDLVTKGTRVPYLVIPDDVLNPLWDDADPTNTTTVTSTWTWTNWVNIGTIFTDATYKNDAHYIMVDVTGIVGTTSTINVKENSGASCPDGGTGTNIIVKIVDVPKASALSVSDGTGATICTSASNTTLNLALPTFTITKTIDASIPNAGIKVKASLDFTNHLGVLTTLIPAGTILNVNASGQISNTELDAAATANGQSYDDLDNWGSYVLTVTQISDKISRKDINAAAGYFDVNGGTALTATYRVYKTPSTGVIYHLPNN